MLVMARKKQNQLNRISSFNPLVNHDFEAVLIGIMWVLIGVLGFTNMTIVSGVFNYTITVFFGNFNFIGFLFIIFLGFYRIIRRQALEIHFNLMSLGLTLTLIATLGLFSHYTLINAGYLTPVTLQNFFNTYKGFIPLLKDIPAIYGQEISGGIVGFMMLGLMTSIGGANGFNLLYVVLAIGVIMSLGLLWRFLFKVIRKAQQERRIEQQHLAAAKAIETPADDFVPVPVESKPPAMVEKPRPTVSFVPRPQQVTTAYSRPLARETQASTLRKPIYRRQTQVDEQPPLTYQRQLQQPVPEAPKQSYEPTPTTSLSLTRPGHQATSVLKRATVTLETVRPDISPSLPRSELSTHESIPQPSSLYEYPSIDLLDDVPEEADFEYNEEIAIKRLAIINEAFLDLGVKAEAVSFQVGPSFTSFDIQLDRSTLVKTVATVINEISIRLGGMPSLFTEVVPGKTTSSLEVPNEKIGIVSFKEIIRNIDANPEYHQRVVIPFGKNILGKIEVLPIKDIIHMLVAGTTGSGKSVFMHTLIMTILMRVHPDDVRLLIIDPKHVEMARYSDIPHLLAPIINDYAQAKVALSRLLNEMHRRYDIMKSVGLLNIDSYNRYARDNGQAPLPLIILIVDEYADLVESIPSISESVERLAAMSRAAGIHLIIATQRPITRVVSGNIKNNIITKVALQMNAQVDSVTVLGHAGAEKLLGNGDMIVSCPKLSRYGELRLQGAFVSEDDTGRIVRFVKSHSQPNYDPDFENLVDVTAMGPAFPGSYDDQPDDMYDEIKRYVMQNEYMSGSRIIRDFKMGFSRVARLIKRLQSEGILAPGPDNPQSNKGIKVLVRYDEIGNEIHVSEE